jgi:4-amino-4-deoxy-L-arabinose transferase-like glycosyltransferase
MLPDYTPTPGSGSVTASEPAGTAGGSSLPGGFSAVVGGAGLALDVFLAQLDRGVRALEPRRLFHVVVRSGRIPGVDYKRTGGYTLELTLLESAPIVAGLFAAPIAIRARSVPTRATPGLLRRDPVRATDLFAAAYVAVFGLLYLPQLPLHSTITVRYLIPTVPFLVYGVCRLEPVHRVAEREGGRLAALAIGLTVAAIAFAAVALAGVGPGTAMQAHGVANLAVAGLFLAWLVAALRTDLDPRVGAAVVALVLAASVAFLLLSGVEYFGHDRQFALPIARTLERLTQIR